MKTRTASWLVAVPALIFNTSEIYPERPSTFQGNIVHGTTRKGVENAYVYIVSGEEESLSGKDGKFSIATWQELPVTLVIEHPLFKTKQLVTKDTLQKQVITLEPK